MDADSNPEEIESPRTEEELREEMIFRFRLIKHQYNIATPEHMKTLTLDQLRELYDVEIAKIEKQKEEREIETLKYLLQNTKDLKLDEKDSDGNDKVYSLKELNAIFDKRLAELNMSRTDFFNYINIMATVALVSGVENNQ